MERPYFETRAALERQIDAARQLRAETLGGGAWIIGALAAICRGIRWLASVLAASTPRSV